MPSRRTTRSTRGICMSSRGTFPITNDEVVNIAGFKALEEKGSKDKALWKDSTMLKANVKGKPGELNITKTELDATFAKQMAEAKAALDAAMVAGASVGTADAQTLGTIDTVEGESVVLALAGETPQKITLGKDMFALDNSGSVIVLATLAQIEAAIPSEG